MERVTAVLNGLDDRGVISCGTDVLGHSLVFEVDAIIWLHFLGETHHARVVAPYFGSTGYEVHTYYLHNRTRLNTCQCVRTRLGGDASHCLAQLVLFDASRDVL